MKNYVFYGLMAIMMVMTTNCNSQKNNPDSKPEKNDSASVQQKDNPQLDQQKDDPIRSQIKWDSLAAPANNDGEIETIYFGYTRPDGKHFSLNTELTFPIASDEFKGGDVFEKDINFDGIPDLQISLGYISGFGTEIFDAWVWDSQKQEFVNVEGYSEIPSPEIDEANKRIMSYDRTDDEIEVAEYKWKNGMLVLTDRHTEKIEKE